MKCLLCLCICLYLYLYARVHNFTLWSIGKLLDCNSVQSLGAWQCPGRCFHENVTFLTVSTISSNRRAQSRHYSTSVDWRRQFAGVFNLYFEELWYAPHNSTLIWIPVIWDGHYNSSQNRSVVFKTQYLLRPYFCYSFVTLPTVFFLPPSWHAVSSHVLFFVLLFYISSSPYFLRPWDTFLQFLLAPSSLIFAIFFCVAFPLHLSC